MDEEIEGRLRALEIVVAAIALETAKDRVARFTMAGFLRANAMEITTELEAAHKTEAAGYVLGILGRLADALERERPTPRWS